MATINRNVHIDLVRGRNRRLRLKIRLTMSVAIAIFLKTIELYEGVSCFIHEEIEIKHGGKDNECHIQKCRI